METTDEIKILYTIAGFLIGFLYSILIKKK